MRLIYLKNLKNYLKNNLLSNKIITIPENFTVSNNLQFSTVEYKHLDELIEIQENLQFKLTSRIHKNDINCITFAKMKVNK